MTVVGELFSRVFGGGHKRYLASMEREIAHHEANQRQSAQVLESGSRVMQNMTGMMRMMTGAVTEDDK